MTKCIMGQRWGYQYKEARELLRVFHSNLHQVLSPSPSHPPSSFSIEMSIGSLYVLFYYFVYAIALALKVLFKS